jgi:transcriptional regulator with XRE-family HTH domain
VATHEFRYDYAQFCKALGKRIKELRKERGLTHRALVAEYGFHLTQIARIERGDPLSVPTLLRLAETFQIRVEDMIANIGVVRGSRKGAPSRKE